MEEQTVVVSDLKDSDILSHLPELVFEERENGFGYVMNKANGKMFRFNPSIFLVFKLCNNFPVNVARKAYKMEMSVKQSDQTAKAEECFNSAVSTLIERGLICVSSAEKEKLKTDYRSVEIHVVNAYLELTSLCNAFCPYCYNRSGAGGRHMDSTLLFNVLQQIVDFGVDSITISGGEPTLHPDFIGVIDFCKTNGLQTNVITNGWFGDRPEYIKALTGCNVQFTLDHTISEVHDAIKGTGNYAAVGKAMLALSGMDNKGQRKLRVNLSRTNEQYIDAFVKKGRELNAVAVEFQFLHKIGRDTEYDGHIDYNEKPEMAERIIQALENMKVCRTPEDAPRIVLAGCLPTNTCNFLTIKNNRFNCLVRVDSNGDVFPCQFFSAPYFSLGNIKEQSFREIIFSDRLYDLLEILNFRSTNNSSCNACVWENICKKGCPAKAYTIYNTIWQKSGECKMWKHMKEKSLGSSSIVGTRHHH